MQIVQEVGPVGRKWRRPKHPFQMVTRPCTINPFFIAPVLPGETMKNLLLQSRVVSDPINHALIGWWQEYYFFYVKHRDTKFRDKLTAMMLNVNEDMSTVRTAAANAATFHAANTIDWVQICLERVVEEYFRDEGEAWNAGGLVDGMPLAKLHGKQESYLDSLLLDSAMPDIDPEDTSAQVLEPQYATWEYMRDMKMTNMSYEDWLRTFGVNTKREHNKPELIRYVKDWTYPSNTVNPADGLPSSALSWSMAERADKDRFFHEPGFLIGVTVTRPKVYLSNLAGSLTGWMDGVMSWLPALMRDEPATSLRNFAASSGPIPSIASAGGYWLDIRDLFLYGEQFTNFALSGATGVNKVALPTAAGVSAYPSAAELDGFFKLAANNKIRQDGVVALGILGGQVDHT